MTVLEQAWCWTQLNFLLFNTLIKWRMAHRSDHEIFCLAQAVNLSATMVVLLGGRVTVMA